MYVRLNAPAQVHTDTAPRTWWQSTCCWFTAFLIVSLRRLARPATWRWRISVIESTINALKEAFVTSTQVDVRPDVQFLPNQRDIALRGKVQMQTASTVDSLCLGPQCFGRCLPSALKP